MMYDGSMYTEIGWGVIGAGDVCERKSGPPLYLLEGSRLEAVYRRNHQAAEDFVKRHGHGRTAPSLQGLLADEKIHAVYVASPHHLHAEQTIAALEAGKHVLVEKPMALTVAECDRMVQAATEAGRSLAVAYYRRGYPAIRRLQQLLSSGTIGTIRTVSINSEFPTSHRIDLVHFLFGPIACTRRVAKKVAGGYRLEQTMPRIFLETHSAVTVQLTEQWVETGAPESLFITGDRGSIHLWDLKGGHLSIHRDETVTHESCGTLPWTHWGLMENMIRHLTAGEPLLCDGPAGRASTVILERIDQCAQSGDSDWATVDY